MLKQPKLDIVRSEDAEDMLTDKTKDWLEAQNKERDPRIHASDLLDPRKAYWNRQHKEVMTKKMVGNFFVGKVLHAFYLSALHKAEGVDWKSDEGGNFDKELGITFSPDWATGTVPGELKTSRAVNEQTNRDLSTYTEQLCIYMAAMKSLVGRLVVLRIMGKDKAKGWGTYPQYRAYKITWDKAGLAGYRAEIKKTVKLLTEALKKKDPSKLEKCRKWKCGKGNCGHWELCRPEGRYNLPENKWEA